MANDKNNNKIFDSVEEAIYPLNVSKVYSLFVRFNNSAECYRDLVEESYGSFVKTWQYVAREWAILFSIALSFPLHTSGELIGYQEEIKKSQQPYDLQDLFIRIADKESISVTEYNSPLNASTLKIKTIVEVLNVKNISIDVIYPPIYPSNIEYFIYFRNFKGFSQRLIMRIVSVENEKLLKIQNNLLIEA